MEQCHEIVQKTEEGVLAYLGSGLIKGIGEKIAARIVARFGVDALDILENHPERLLGIPGITESRLEFIMASCGKARLNSARCRGSDSGGWTPSCRRQRTGPIIPCG